MTREEFRDYVEFLRSQDEISYDVYSGLIDGIDTLEQELCDDAINRQAVLDLINADWKYEGLESDIENLPPVSPQSKIAHWISHYDEDAKEGWYECDRCHTERAFNTDYCPDCGCRMVEPQESEK